MAVNHVNVVVAGPYKQADLRDSLDRQNQIWIKRLPNKGAEKKIPEKYPEKTWKSGMLS